MNPNSTHKNILIIADIEGSSGCWSYEGSAFMTEEWAQACFHMSQDVNAVITALFDAGTEEIMVKDFHRTGYNVIPDLIDKRATLVSGYRRKPIPGIGDPSGATGLMMIGMHAASGTDGFLAHTLTSRLAKLEVNGRPMTEAELFSASVAPLGLRPVFFSGCPVACAQASSTIPHIHTWPIDKSGGKQNFPAEEWRTGLAQAAANALTNRAAVPYLPKGPFEAMITLRDGAPAAIKLAQKWGHPREGAVLRINAPNIHDLYLELIRLCYLSPFIERILPIGMPMYNLVGRFGLAWAQGKRSKR